MDTEQFEKKDGFNLVWQSVDSKPTSSIDGFFAMREWQIRAFDRFKAEPLMILNAPMGSGKSWFMCLLSAFKMKTDRSLRSIIVVPQTIIASGFINAKIQMPDGEKLHWQIKHNLCKEECSKGTVNYFIKWLEKESRSIVLSERVILCTHATLVAAFKKLKSEGRLYLFKNVLLWIDEAHHVKNVVAEGFDDAVINNNIGELVTYLLDDSLANVQIGLTTASFFRGDRASLLTDDMEARFKRFNLPYDEYLKSMKYLKSFSFNFLLSGHSYVKGIEQVIRSRKGKDIIYIPHPMSQYSTGNKYQEVDNIISIYGNISHTTKDGVIVVQGKDGERKILDLVSEAQRKQKKSYLDNPIIKKQHDALDVIIAVGMFKEGANWIYANRSIIVGARSSLVDVYQMVGRLFRDAEGKRHVEVIQLLPFSLDQRDEESFRENLNNYLKAIYASLILENILNPVKIKPMQKVENKASNEDGDNTKTNWLNLVLPDDAMQSSLMEEVNNHLVDIIDRNKEALCNTSVLYDEYEKTIPEILENHGISEHKEEVAKQIWGMLVRRSMQMQGISVENIDFNIVQKTHPLGFLLRYTSGSCDVNTFERLREAIQLSRIVWCSFEDAREFARSLNLTNVKKWRIWAKNIDRPKDIPVNPDRTYKDNGWISWGDFLGTEAVATKKYVFKLFEEAKEFVRSLNLTSETEWRLYIAGEMPHLPLIPRDIPRAPWVAYANSGWLGWGDFLGTGVVAPRLRKYCSYEEACIFVHTLGLKRKDDWVSYTKGTFPTLPSLPNNIPASPAKTYKRKEYGEKWVSWGNFLGTGKISNQHKSKNYVPYAEAQKFAQSLKLKSSEDWKKYIKGEFLGLPALPVGIPKKPDTVYKEFKWHQFLGCEVSRFNCKRDFWPFDVAREYVHKLGLKNQEEWNEYCAGKITHLPSKPLEIPSNPQKKYKAKWKGLRDWLGSSNK
jgi:superfamily II DNA or RNA helicase